MYKIIQAETLDELENKMNEMDKYTLYGNIESVLVALTPQDEYPDKDEKINIKNNFFCLMYNPDVLEE